MLPPAASHSPAVSDSRLAAFLAGADLPALRRALLRWYARHARDLPWRRTRDPFAVWISEIMLQQTTVAAVIPRYQEFLARFPSLRDLAAASEHDVLKAWEGLGYYSRARHLHRAAQQIVAQHAGRIPHDVAALHSLPGIGRYTAGAIASFAFDRREPIVEANTLRLYARLLGFRGDPRSAAGQSLLWEFAARLLPAQSCGRFNQALIELGATVCLPAAPRCPRCPLRRNCIACLTGAQGEIPSAGRRPKAMSVVEVAVAIRRRGCYLLRRRGHGERWAGLWDFPRFEAPLASRLPPHPPRELPPPLRRACEVRLAELTGLGVSIDAPLMQIDHTVTRYRIRLLCLTARHRDGTIRGDERGWTWIPPSGLARLALPTSSRRFALWLQHLPGGRGIGPAPTSSTADG